MKRCLKRMPTECVENKMLSMPDDSGMLFLFAPNRGTIEERKNDNIPKQNMKEAYACLSERSVSLPTMAATR